MSVSVLFMSGLQQKLQKGRGRTHSHLPLSTVSQAGRALEVTRAIHLIKKYLGISRVVYQNWHEIYTFGLQVMGKEKQLFALEAKPSEHWLTDIWFTVKAFITDHKTKDFGRCWDDAAMPKLKLMHFILIILFVVGHLEALRSDPTLSLN